MSEDGVEGRLVDALEANGPTDRTRLIKMRAVKNPVCNTPKASSTNAERIERASYEVEKRTRTLRTWFEGVSVDRVCKVMPDTVRNCAWRATRRLVRSGRVKQIERPCGRSHNDQVSEFAELNHFREPQKAGDMSKHRYKTGCALPCNDRSSGGQKGCMACCKHAGANPRDSRTRSLDTVDTQSKFKRLTIKTTVQFEQRHHARLKWWHSAGCGWTDPRRRTAT